MILTVEFFDGFESETVPDVDEAIVPIDGFYYIGQPDVNGSWRIGVDSGNLIFEKRISDAWVIAETTEAQS
jgi:hypothetical protein